MTAAWIEEPKSGVNYKLSGDDLVGVIKQAVRDDDWQFTTFGATIVLRRFPRTIRPERDREVRA
jgi:hypothetical protein